jgi:lipopolysaccharide export system ATP-binding protein
MSYSDEIPNHPHKNARGVSKDGWPIDPSPPMVPKPNQQVEARPPGNLPPPRQSMPQPSTLLRPPQRVPGPPGNPPISSGSQPSSPLPVQSAPIQNQRVPVAPLVNQPPPKSVVSAPAIVSVGAERPRKSSEHLTFASGSTGGKPSAKELLLDTEGLVKIYNGRTVVNGVNINVKRGEIVGLLGPNGAGKTTSFYMMVGLVPPNGGKVIFDGHDVTKMPMYKRARLGMGYLPQEESIFRKLTVEENIMAVMQTMSYSRKEKQARCDELLERFSITHIRKNIAMACSGGEKRRVTIARSLVPNPSLIMLDEPFGGVDPIAVGEIQSIVKDLRKEGLAVLITDHNARETLDLVDRAYLICEGRVLREGPKEFLINDPVSRQLYLGERFSM